MRGPLLVATFATACTFSPGQSLTSIVIDADTGSPHDSLHHDSAVGTTDAAPTSDATAGADAKQCSSTYFLKNGASAYRLTITSQVNQMEAEADCEFDGGHLVKIEDTTENSFIIGHLTGNGFVWIGLADPGNVDQYVWTDGTALGSFNSFSGGTVPGSPDNCVDMGVSTGTWSAFTCAQNHSGFCECP